MRPSFWKAVVGQFEGGRGCRLSGPQASSGHWTAHWGTHQMGHGLFMRSLFMRRQSGVPHVHGLHTARRDQLPHIMLQGSAALNRGQPAGL